MKYIYILDRLINKPIRLQLPANLENDKFEYGEKILYKNQDCDDNFIGTYLGYPCDSLKTGTFIKRLGEKEQQQFESNKKDADKAFELFKKEFKGAFPDSIPVTARVDLTGRVAYFYFYAESRFDFVGFLKEFRKKISYNFFLFQIGARDRIRMSPGAEDIYGTCGYKICCKSGKCPLPTVDADNIQIQNLENRGIEKMKGRCGKLKCCLNYEKNIYINELGNYPRKGDEFKYESSSMKCCGFNIMNGEIIAKNKDDDIKKIDQKEYAKYNPKNLKDK